MTGETRVFFTGDNRGNRGRKEQFLTEVTEKIEGLLSIFRGGRISFYRKHQRQQRFLEFPQIPFPLFSPVNLPRRPNIFLQEATETTEVLRISPDSVPSVSSCQSSEAAEYLSTGDNRGS
jgi:hypothetical protein